MAIIAPKVKPPEKKLSVFFIASAIQAILTVLTYFALAWGIMATSGHESPVVNALLGIYQWLAMPTAWLARGFLEENAFQVYFDADLIVRFLNILLVSALISWAWKSLRRPVRLG